MTIKPGEAWGRVVERPDGLVAVDSDAELVRRLTASNSAERPPLLLTGGDLARTLGTAGSHRRNDAAASGTVNEMPIDLVEVRVDGGVVICGCAHVVMRSSWWRGGWLRGPIVMVMNAEFFGTWDVAPRGHPNDGRADVIEADSSLGIRQRLAARRRLPSGAHLPHPGLRSRSVRTTSWTFASPVVVIVDGRTVGRARTVDVAVLADAAIIHT